MGNLVWVRIFRSFYVYGKLFTCPSPKPTLIIISHLGKNVGLGEGWVSSFSETYNPILFGQNLWFEFFPFIQRCKIFFQHYTP